MKTHPVAELFPMLGTEEMLALASSISKQGQLVSCVKQGDVLLDGRNRIAACKIAGVEPRFEEFTGDSPTSFIVSINLARRHLNPGQKATLGVEIEPFFAEEAKKRMSAGGGDKKSDAARSGQGSCPLPGPGPQARDLAAAAVGSSGKSVSAAKAVKAASPELFKKVNEGKLSLAAAKKEVKAIQDKVELTQAQESIDSERRLSIDAVCDIRVCSCADLFASGIKPDAVITDPPYPREFLPVFTELAESCAKAGVPLVAVMSGQSYLPEVMERLCKHLQYRWTLAYMTPGGQAVQQWQAKVNTSWKPVLLFGESAEWFGDVAVSKMNDNDKRFHGWGQSESGTADLVERLTKPGQLICDPFLGGGTTAVVALALGRRFVGCDISEECVEKSRMRLL